VKNNQPGVFQDIAFFLKTGGTPIFSFAIPLTVLDSKLFEPSISDYFEQPLFFSL